VAFRVSMTRLIVRAMANRSSTSRYALGSSSKYNCAFLDRQAAMATRWSSPPLSWAASLSRSGSRLSGSWISVLYHPDVNSSFAMVLSRSVTVP